MNGHEGLSGSGIFRLELRHIENKKRNIALDPVLEASDREIFERYPAEEMVRSIERRLEREKPVRTPFPAAVPARMLPLLAAALLAVMVGAFAFRPQVSGRAVPGTERIKGMEPVLSIFRAEGGDVRMLEGDERARAFDLLQLEYNGAGYPYGTIFSIDGRGVITLHYPASAALSTRLEKGTVLLPYSYQLDDAPGFERFFFVASKEEFSPGDVLEAARSLAEKESGARGGRLELPGDFVQSSVTILKEETE